MGLFKNFYNNLLKEREEGKTYSYSSSQFDLNPSISEEIYNWGLENVPDSQLGSDGRQDKNDIHLTLCYGLITEYPEDLTPLIQCFKPFTLKLGVLDIFRKEDQDVLKINLYPNVQLMMMNQFIKNNLKVFETFPMYSPHISICFTKSGFSEQFIGSRVFDGREVYLDGVSFSSKLGQKTFIPFIPEIYSPPIGKFNVRFRS